LKKKRRATEADVVEGVSDTYVLMTFIDNISTHKGWILNSGSTGYVCSQKEMFYSFVAKEEGTAQMVHNLACGIIGTGTVNIIGRDGTMRALEAVSIS